MESEIVRPETEESQQEEEQQQQRKLWRSKSNTSKRSDSANGSHSDQSAISNEELKELKQWFQVYLHLICTISLTQEILPLIFKEK